LVLEIDPHIFAVLRSDPHHQEYILCLINASPEQQMVSIDLKTVNLPTAGSILELIEDEVIQINSRHLDLTLDGYQTMWLTAG
jgi:hypothetical protein